MGKGINFDACACSEFSQEDTSTSFKRSRHPERSIISYLFGQAVSKRRQQLLETFYRH